jgi:mono/diheme cytochrome c family protein
VSRDRLAAVLIAFAWTTFNACGRLPGEPSRSARPEIPSQVTNFGQLYGENCAGCHGAGGRFGAALPLNSPAYLALVDDASMRRAIADGISGTSMPAFAVRSGGMLTDEQITAILNGIRSQWGAGARPVQETPPYLSSKVGDATRGEKLFGDYCASCHGSGGSGGTAGAIAIPPFLALYDDQTLRTLIIVGRPDLGHPGSRDYKPALDSAQVTDIVAWLAVKRGS